LQVKLKSIIPKQNRYRKYTVRIDRTLWGGYSVTRAWGRIGQRGRTKVDMFPDVETARAHMEKLVRLRLRRGYRMVEAQA